MKKIAQRLLMFCIGLPLVLGIVILLPQHHHLALNLLAVIFSGLGAMEFAALLSQKQLGITGPAAAALGVLPPLAMLLIVTFGLSDTLLFAVITAAVVWLLMSCAFSRTGALNNVINRLTAGFAVLVYPGMPIAWLVRMSRWEHNASAIIITFLAVVFCGDGAAWAAGMLFGKGNQGVIPASPNKSVAGFIGGAAATIGVGVVAALLCPDVFVVRHRPLGGMAPFAGAVLGLLTGIAAACGDLAESAIKRSSGIKDSGTIIPGRGGVLDSIDSIALAAPVFYLVFSLLFMQP